MRVEIKEIRMDNRYEQEINLKELFFYILRKWRPIIFCTIIALILLGGYKFSKAFFSQRNQTYVDFIQEQYDKELKEYKTSKKGYERTINTLTNTIEYEEQYENDSILFNIDSNNKWVASVDVFIQISVSQNNTFINVDPADSIVKAYMSAIGNGSFLEQLSKKLNIDTPFVNELIGVEADNEGNVLSISVTYKDEEGAKEIIDTILEALDSMYAKVHDDLGEHSMVIMNQNIGMEIDQELADRQKKRVDDLEVMRKKLVETQNALDELIEPQKPSALSISTAIKTGIKFGIIGAITGVFVTIFIYCVIYVMSSKLHSAEELKNRFNLKILGAFMQEREKRAFSQVDNLIDKLEGSKKVSEVIAYQRVTANISNYSEKGQTILLTGTVNQDEMISVINKLRQMLPDIKLETGFDMTKNPETLKKLSKVDAVILIEKIGYSKYSDIQEELESIYDLSQKVIGCIVL